MESRRGKEQLNDVRLTFVFEKQQQQQQNNKNETTTTNQISKWKAGEEKSN